MKKAENFFTIFVSFVLLLFSLNIGFAEEVVFVDSKLKEAVKDEFYNKEKLTLKDVEELESLPSYFQWESIGISDISDLSGLEHAVKLEALGIQDSTINDFSVLSELKNLWKLMLASCRISDMSGLVSAIAELENLESLNLKDNQISDIALLTNLKGLKTLNLQNNPLNEQAYKVHIPKIRKNNPGIKIAMAFRSIQLLAPAIVFAVFIIAALAWICRSWNTRGWLFELLAGIASAAVGCFLGLGAQILYVYTDSFIEFFGNGYENPPWVGGGAGAIFGLLAGVWLTKFLRGLLEEWATKGIIIVSGIKVGVILGATCSSMVHLLLMVAYHNITFWPMLIGLLFGVVGGFFTGLVISVVFILTHKLKSIPAQEI